ncbi:MAG: IclR family transcriptional regulator [Eubacteriales bacterium]|nr:IclR family transcriptional regulator [Eubacteriales bacterium]
MSNNKKDNSQKYILSSLDNALSILNLFFDKEEMSVSDIAARMGINRSTAFRMLVTLEKRGFLTKKENAKYRLGGKIFSLGQVAYSRMELIPLVHPYLEVLTEKTKETSHLVIMDDANHIVFVDKIIGTLSLKMDTPVGLRLSAHATATGKSILAYKPQEFVEKYIEEADFTPHTKKSIADGKALIKELELIRERGYAVDDEETEIGLTCYGVPIIDASGNPIAAISSSGPTSRMAANHEKYVKVLQESVKKISGSVM